MGLEQFLVVSLLASVQIQYVYGLTCLFCKEIAEPRHCRRVKQCDAGEACSLEQDTNEFGEIVFNLGCRPTSICNDISTGSHCSTCCNSDICNKEGCGRPGYTYPRGPVCYNCKSPTLEGRCHDIDICEQGEVCIRQGRYQFGEELYVTSCTSHHSCTDLTTTTTAAGTGLIGKRSHEIHTCDNCCTGDLCNRYCNQTFIPPVTNSPVTTLGPVTSGNISISPSVTAPVFPGVSGYDCLDILTNNPAATTGVYTIRTPNTSSIIEVYCDMDTDGGGWTVFMNRFDGSVDFNRNYTDYENGFGSAAGEHWLALQYIYELTAYNNNSLRMDMVSYSNLTSYEVNSNFSVEGPSTNYRINVGPQVKSGGILESDPWVYHNGRGFTTYDVDNDEYVSGNCAVDYHGGFWYNECFKLNPTGLYSGDGTVGNMAQTDFTTYQDERIWKLMFRRV